MVKAFYRNVACHHRAVDRSISAPFSIFTFPSLVLRISPDLIRCRRAWRGAFVTEPLALLSAGRTWSSAELPASFLELM